MWDEMNPLSAILIICEHDPLFREALRNYLLASGYSQVEIAPTTQEAVTKLRFQCYGYILIGISTPFSHGRRLAAIARRRQPQAKILCLVSAQDMPLFKAIPFECVIKEHVFSNLLGLMVA